jgi:hypothetical protein
MAVCIPALVFQGYWSLAEDFSSKHFVKFSCLLLPKDCVKAVYTLEDSGQPFATFEWKSIRRVLGEQSSHSTVRDIDDRDFSRGCETG